MQKVQKRRIILLMYCFINHNLALSLNIALSICFVEDVRIFLLLKIA